jgi:hypothetical protein
MPDITITATRSAGLDGAVLVFIDTDFEPDASDGGPGLRIMLNDSDAYVGKQAEYADDVVEAHERTFTVNLDEIQYTANPEG